MKYLNKITTMPTLNRILGIGTYLQQLYFKVVVNERQVSDLDVFLSYLSSRLDLPYGAKKLYTTGGKQIKNLFELEDGKEYVASSTVFTPSTYGENNSRFIPHSNSVKTNVLASNTVIIPRNDDNIKKKTKKGKEKTSINGIDEKEKSKAQKPPNTTQKGDHKMGNPSEITSESADEEQQKNKDTEHDKELVQNISQSKESSRSHSPLLQTPSELEESEEDENSDEDQLRRREKNESDRISTKKANNNQGSRLNEDSI
uniref:Doublecortin domain-containing protein n=1 Tax=Heterorhabditis bacteriophora TaxID=37862 RepID=A0A1I7XDP1_HETBA